MRYEHGLILVITLESKLLSLSNYKFQAVECVFSFLHTDFKAQSCASKRVYYFVIEKTPIDSVKELGRKNAWC